MSKFASLMYIIHYYSTLDICHLFLLCQSTGDLSQLTESALSSFPLPGPSRCPIASPISILHNPSIPSDGGSISTALGSASVTLSGERTGWQRMGFILPQSYILGFWNQKRLHHFPNSKITILPEGLWFSKEKLSDKGKAVLLKVVVIYILCISSHLVLSFELMGP